MRCHLYHTQYFPRPAADLCRVTGNYGDYFLSSVVAVLCCLTPLIANFFIVWDSAQPYVLSSPAEIINWILGEVLLAGSYLTSLTTTRYERKRILACATGPPLTRRWPGCVKRAAACW